jgi:hypothetical protein
MHHSLPERMHYSQLFDKRDDFLTIARLVKRQNQALEVSTFRVKKVNRMIGTLAEFMQDAHVPTCFHAGSRHGIPEQIPVYHLAATEGKQQSAWLHLLHAGRIEPFIAHHRIVPFVHAFSVCRRIEYYDIPQFFVFLEIFQGILTNTAMRIGYSIDFGIFIGNCQRFD